MTRQRVHAISVAVNSKCARFLTGRMPYFLNTITALRLTSPDQLPHFILSQVDIGDAHIHDCNEADASIDLIYIGKRIERTASITGKFDHVRVRVSPD